MWVSGQILIERSSLGPTRGQRNDFQNHIISIGPNDEESGLAKFSKLAEGMTKPDLK